MPLPFIDYHDWKDTRITLHLIFQIMGKVRLKSTPRKNHWWNGTLYVSSSGFTTHAIPLGKGAKTFEMNLNIHSKSMELLNSEGESKSLLLKDGYTISQLYQDILKILSGWGIKPKFVPRPYDMGIDLPFDQITAYHHFDWDAITKFWKMMLWVSNVLDKFSGRFYGKTCPVHLYWHHMDLAVTRFSGKVAPPMDPNARISDKDAYSHEVISFGFWAGDDQVPMPAFYSYTYPSPEGIEKEQLMPKDAEWVDSNGSPMALLKYEHLLKVGDPEQELLNFLESAYQAGAKLAQWDLAGFDVPALESM